MHIERKEKKNRKTDLSNRQIERQKDRKTERQKTRKTERHRDIKIDVGFYQYFKNVDNTFLFLRNEFKIY
jgi:hypothetical protein